MNMKHIIAVVVVVVVAIATFLHLSSNTAITNPLKSDDRTFTVAVADFAATLDAIDRQITSAGLPIETALQGEKDVVANLEIVNNAVRNLNSNAKHTTDFPTFLTDLEAFYETLADYKTTFSFIEQSIADAEQTTDISMTTALGETLTLLSEVGASPQNYFQENVPDDFDPSQAEDESERQSAGS